MDVQAGSSGAGVEGGEQMGQARVRRGSSVHQHGVARVVVRRRRKMMRKRKMVVVGVLVVVVVVVVGEEGVVERGSVSELRGVRGHGGGVGGRGHAHAHRTTLRYQLPWHAWQTSPSFSALQDGGYM